MSDPFSVLGKLFREGVLLVGCDYDGTLAPIVARPEQAWPQSGAVEAVESLARLPDPTSFCCRGEPGKSWPAWPAPRSE